MALVVWIVVAVALFAIEATTIAFVALYFGVGALAAALAAALGAPVALQAISFAAVSALSLVSTRGILTRSLQRAPAVRSNVDSLVGRRGIVTLPINGPAGRGQIRVGGEYWTARPYMPDCADIGEGEPVEVLSIEGVTALVLPVERALTE